jgi:hypothetical protein
MKRKLFIGSSKEGLKIAKRVRDIISQETYEWLECTIWNDDTVFTGQRSFFDNLLKAAHRFDYGIFVATADDLAIIRKFFGKIPRGNVVFEMGLFLGSLGMMRAFLLVEKVCKLPSDFNGISLSRFSSKSVNSKSLAPILKQINDTRNSYALRVIPSAALALGYFDNFLLPLCKSWGDEVCQITILLPSNLEDIKAQSDIYKQTHPSKEISVFNDNQRPVVNQEIADTTHYWDFPTTLSTLNKLIKKVVHSTEIGTNPEISDWVEYELRNFSGSLEVLILENVVTKGKVTIEWWK